MNATDAPEFSEDKAAAIRQLSAVIDFARCREGIFRSLPLWNEDDLRALRDARTGRDFARCQDGSGLSRLRLAVVPGAGSSGGELLREVRQESGGGWEPCTRCGFRTAGADRWDILAPGEVLPPNDGSRVAFLAAPDGSARIENSARDASSVRALFRRLAFDVADD